MQAIAIIHKNILEYPYSAFNGFANRITSFNQAKSADLYVLLQLYIYFYICVVLVVWINILVSE